MARSTSLRKALITIFTADYLLARVARPSAWSNALAKRMNTANQSWNGLGWIVSVGLVTIAGCGGTYDSTARGVVTLDGNPVPRGTVSFHPVAGGPAVYAMIDMDGHYAVHTGRADGLPSGEYVVSVTANEAPATARSEKGGPPSPGKAITPAWYRMKETSGLKYTVQPGKNEINLELKSQPPAGWKTSAGK
jgi:hypothetical protein